MNKESEKQKNKYISYGKLKIDTLIFEQKFVPRCDLELCFGQCCDWGVYVDINFVEVIISNRYDIINSMDDEQPKNPDNWFEKNFIKDEDFPSGFAVSTNVYERKNGTEQCIFKDKNNFCSLQVSAMKRETHKWEIKPFHCILYPVTFDKGILSYDSEHSINLNYCGLNHPENHSQSVFEAMTEEICYVFGDECLTFLSEYYRNNYNPEYEIKYIHNDK